MAAPLSPLSASVTRILSLSGFPSELKTRDIQVSRPASLVRPGRGAYPGWRCQAAFVDWENVNGGFKIKWRDDTSLLIVFADAGTGAPPPRARRDPA